MLLQNVSAYKAKGFPVFYSPLWFISCHLAHFLGSNQLLIVKSTICFLSTLSLRVNKSQMHLGNVDTSPLLGHDKRGMSRILESVFELNNRLLLKLVSSPGIVSLHHWSLCGLRGHGRQLKDLLGCLCRYGAASSGQWRRTLTQAVWGR